MNSSHISLALYVLLLAVVGSALSSENQEAAKSASSGEAPQAGEVSVPADEQEVAAVEERTVEEATNDVRLTEDTAASTQTP